MAFVFRFEKLLKLKMMIEEKLQRDFYMKTNEYTALMNELVELKNSRDEAILRRKRMEREGARSPQFNVIEDFLEGNKRLCIEKIGEIKESRKAVDLKKQELLEASREERIYEKLRENAFKEYRIKKEAVGLNQLDEMAGAYYGRAD